MLRVTSATDCSHQTGDIDGPADPSVLLNTMAVNLKVCRELLQQAQASLDCVEARRGRGHRAVAPPFAHYSLFRLLPEDSEWVKSLETQLCTCIYELLLKEQLTAALSFLAEGPTEECTLYQSAEGPTQGSSLHQSAEGPTLGPSLHQPAHQSAGHLSAELTEGPTLYQSALDLFPSENTQEQQLSGGAQTQDLSDCSKTIDQSDRITGAILSQMSDASVYAGCLRERSGERNGERSGESSDEGPPQPAIGLLHMEVGDLSGITHSPPHHQKILSLLFRRHLTPCNSTPQSTGVQPIFDSCPLVISPYTSQSFCTAVDESANLSYQQVNSNSAVRKAVSEHNQEEGDLKAGMKRTEDHLLFESAGTVEGEAQGTAEGETQGTAEGKTQRTAEGESEGKAVGEIGGTAEGESEGTAEGESEGTAKGEPQGTAEGRVEEEFGGTAEGESEETVEGESEGTAQGDTQGTAEGEFGGTAEGESERTAQAQEGEVNNKDWELAQCHQPSDVSHMDIRTHLTLDNVLDCIEEKDSALVYKVSSRSESREGSVESLPSTHPSKDCCSQHGQGEPLWASLDGCRAHSTLDNILQTHIED
ncbi:hypothetical protein NQD34_010368 [Periophthalmus magnuspinnatus]|nr:hypothetical protein NQD34_010368 [Periophthalmus magnuspinnatus]